MLEVLTLDPHPPVLDGLSRWLLVCEVCEEVLNLFDVSPVPLPQQEIFDILMVIQARMRVLDEDLLVVAPGNSASAVHLLLQDTPYISPTKYMDIVKIVPDFVEQIVEGGVETGKRDERQRKWRTRRRLDNVVAAQLFGHPETSALGCTASNAFSAAFSKLMRATFVKFESSWICRVYVACVW